MGLESTIFRIFTENGLSVAFGFVICIVLYLLLKSQFKQHEKILEMAQEDRKHFLETISKLQNSIDQNTKATTELCWLHKK